MDNGGGKKNKNSLFLYLAIMFAAAFLLVLLSFLAQQRESRQTISSLTQRSDTATGRVQELEELYSEAVNQVAILEQEKADMTTELDKLRVDNEALNTNYAVLLDSKKDLEADYLDLSAQLDAVEEELAAKNDALVLTAQERDALTAQAETLNGQLVSGGQLLAAVEAYLGQERATAAQLLAQVEASKLSAPALALYQTLSQKLSQVTSEHAN